MCSGRARLTPQSPQRGLSSSPLTHMSNDTCSFHYSVEWKVLVTKVHRDGLGSSHPSKVFFLSDYICPIGSSHNTLGIMDRWDI